MKRKHLLQTLLVIVCCYIATSIWIHLNLNVNRKYLVIHAHTEQRFDDPFGSKILDKCFDSETRNFLQSEKQLKPLDQADGAWQSTSYVCPVHIESEDIDIQMEKEWDQIHVGYPQFVLSVSGWVNTLQIKSWTPKELNVFIIPFSHQDPGWTLTYDQYYYEKTQKTLSLMVEKLVANPHWKFIWEVVTYLEKWWLTASQTERQAFRRLIERGQLEITTGGWVMTDEGTAHYTAMLDQLMEGHQWLSRNLFIDVQTSWSIDPFGHSSTMPYLLYKSGIKHMVIQRVHFAVKRHLAHLKSLEFFWHQGWGDGHNDTIFCHMMPFLSYGIPFSCGPDEHVCCQFDFYNKKCRRGTKLIDALTVNERNLETLSWQLWEQLQKKSELYLSNVLLVPHGDDFRFLDAGEWDAQFQNLEKIMGYINNNKNMKTKIQFGTLRDYFQALQRSSSGPQYQHYPTFSGDFFPYTDRADQYWSGLYTSRPFHKSIARHLQALLRSAEIWFTLVIARGLVLGKNGKPPSSSDILTRLSSVRHSLAVHQHHDAITGTSKAKVMKDYAERLHTAVMEASNIITEVLRTAILFPNQDMEPNVILHMVENMKTDTSLPELETIEINKDRLILVSNSVGQSRLEIISIHVNRLDIEVLLTMSSKPVRFQVGPVYTQGHMISDKHYKLSFEANLPGLSAILFTVRVSKENWKQRKAVIKVFKHAKEKLFQGPFSATRSEEDYFHLENSFITAAFHTCNGKLQHLYSKLYGKGHQVEINFVTYETGSRSQPFRDKSGSYIFLPDGPAKILPADYLIITVIEGHLLSEVWTEQQDLLHKVTIYNTTGPNGHGIHIENTVRLDDKWNNTELLMRIESDIRPYPHTMCTDVNGFQLHRRKTRQKLTIQGNFYPMTTMALVEDTQSRLSLLTRESHGIASLVPGWIEVVLDRRLVQDDWRGMGEGLQDNLPTKSHFVLQVEERTTIPLTSHSCHPSLQASQMSQLMENPPIIASVHTTNKGEDLLNKLKDYLPQNKAFPCDIHLVNLKTLNCNVSSADSLMVLHRHGIDCGFQMFHKNCHLEGKFDLRHLTDVQISNITEMYLTGIKVKQKIELNTPLDVKPMELKTYKLLFSGN